MESVLFLVLLQEWPELRHVLGLQKVPHSTTLRAGGPLWPALAFSTRPCHRDQQPAPRMPIRRKGTYAALVQPTNRSPMLCLGLP